MAGLLGLLAAALRRWIDLAQWPFVTWPLALYLVMAGFGQASDTWEHVRLRTYALRNPNLTITDRRVLADFAWMRANVPPDALVFNAPADWGGRCRSPATGWCSGRAAAELAGLGVRYIYAASLDEALNRQPLEPGMLRDAAALEVLYESPTATVLHVRREEADRLGLRDSDRIRFDNFYTIETLDGREWRWSRGRGRLRLTVPPGGECFLRILGSDPDAYVMTIGERALDLAPRGFRLPAGSLLEIDIGPGPGHAPPDAPGNSRDLGVRVIDVWLACPGEPGRTSG